MPPLERAPRNFTQDTNAGVIVDVFYDHFLQKIEFLILMKI
jgi:acyl carrier protein phosphodiesterase